MKSFGVVPSGPLVISPLFQYDNPDRSSCERETAGRYETVQRLVSTIPNGPNDRVGEFGLGEVETCLEEYVTPNGDCLWRRLSVYAGPGHGASRTVHASYTLQSSGERRDSTTDDSNGYQDSNSGHSLFCWASFPERKNHKLLCALSSPSLLCIWDVYPTPTHEDRSNEGEGGGIGDGHSIPLPFEASAIFPLSEDNGLLLQRVDTFEDSRLYEPKGGSSWMTDDEEEDIVLSDPPKPHRFGMLVSPSATDNPLGISAATPSSYATSSIESVPSHFALRHPLDEVLPIATACASDQGLALMSDVYEKLLFVGAARWTDAIADLHKKHERSQPICVTYHTRLKRHAVWAFKSAPQPPPIPPLWEISRNQRMNETTMGRRSRVDAIDDPSHIVDEGELRDIVGEMQEKSPLDDGHIPISQKEALADVLGVKHSKKTEDIVSNRARTKGGRRTRRSSLPSQPASFLSPPPVNNAGRRYQPDVDHESKKSVDVTRDNYEGPQNAVFSGTSMALSTVSHLYPYVSMNLLYEEDVSTGRCYEEASNVFLASNIEGSGTLLLCLACPVSNKKTPVELRCFSLAVESGGRKPESDYAPSINRDNKEHNISLSPLMDIPCLSAQPIQSIPISPCYCPSRQVGDRCLHEPMATDILILNNTDEPGKLASSVSLALYRGGNHVADCALAARSPTSLRLEFEQVVGIANGVADRMDFICKKDKGEDITVRGFLNLSFSSDCERLLGAIENALVADLYDIFRSCVPAPMPIEMELALRIRAHCVRLCQSLYQETEEENIHATEKPGLSSVSTVVSSVLNDLVRSSLGADTHEADEIEPMETSPAADDNAAWFELLNSDFHNSYVADSDSTLFLCSDGGGKSRLVKDVAQSNRSLTLSSLVCLQGSREDATFFGQRIFDALHLVYEDLKLSRSFRSSYLMKETGSILVSVCDLVDKICLSGNLDHRRKQTVMGDFLDHYRRDLGVKFVENASSSVRAFRSSSSLRIKPDQCRGFITSFKRPPCFLSWIDGIMRGKNTELFTDLRGMVVSACCMTRSLQCILSILFRSQENQQNAGMKEDLPQTQKDRASVMAMIENGMEDPTELDELPVGVALPLLETLYRCRGQPPSSFCSDWSASAWSLIGRDDLAQYNSHATDALPLPVCSSWISRVDGSQSVDAGKDGLKDLELSAAMRFPDDNRVREAGRLLRSSRPSFLSVSRAVEISDHDYERLKQDRLMVLCRRVLALPVGRGMLTLGTLRPALAEPLAVPQLCLSGRVPPTNATLALDVSGCPPDMKVWPEFHNGVAVGLRLRCKEGGVQQITRTWIAYNRKRRSESDTANSSGGSTNDGSSEPGNQTDHVYGGLLLAFGLRGHLSSLSMTDMYDYLTEGTVTTTVGLLLGMAANRRGSCDTSISKILCLHVPSLLPQSFAAIDVASPAQSAAVSGIGLLYQGSSHRLMTEFLLNEMARGPANNANGFDRAAYSLSCGLALGMVNLSRGDQIDSWVEDGGGAGLADLHIGERLHRFIVGGADDFEVDRRKESSDRSNTASGVEGERSSMTYEGGVINTAVTAPGATLALGLMYLQSGNEAIASSLALPDTHFLLEYVRPDLLLFRVIARSLILWDDVVPSSKWIEAQIPTVISKSYSRMRMVVARLSDISHTAGLSSPTCNGLWSRGKHNQEMETEEPSGLLEEHEVDRQSVRQIYSHVVAGACFAIGLRFAGTGDKRAASAICERLMIFLSLRDDPAAFALKPELPVLDTCMGCAAIALAMVMSGTGDLKTLRLFKMLRWRCDEGVTYGSHMAYGAAIGLLFLGGGNCALGRDPADVAALVMAFFPRFPSSSSDNQYHLQALRHCYALAVKHRGLRAFDVDTLEEVFIPVQIEVADQQTTSIAVTTPCLLQGDVRQLRVMSHRYYPITLRAKEISEAGRSLFVKKRSGFVSCLEKPHSQRSMLMMSGSSARYCVLEQIKSFADNPRMLAYAQYLCDDELTSGKGPTPPSSKALSISTFCTDMLHGCLASDKEEALQLYLSLLCSVESLKTSSAVAVDTVWDVRLVRAYYGGYHHLLCGQSTDKRLLDPEYVSVLIEKVNGLLLNDTGSSCGEDRRDGCFLTWYGVPS